MLLVRIKYSVLCACVLSIPHPITFGQKNRSCKVYKNTLPCVCDCKELRWITKLALPVCYAVAMGTAPVPELAFSTGTAACCACAFSVNDLS